MADFIEAAQLNQIPPGTSIMVRVADKDVALFNLDGAVYAISDTCAHQGSSLAAGELEGKIVRCLSHGWKYDVTMGKLTVAPELGVPCYPVQVVDGTIMVAVD